MKNRRILILGLDGMPFSLLQNFVSSGLMKSTGAILKNGKFVQTNASIPDVSAVSWSTFITGKSPSEHSIFGFVDIDPLTYKIIFPNFLDNKCETFWERESERGKKCIVVNVPETYPVRPYNGILISGFPAVNINKAVHPPDLIKWLEKMEYTFDVNPPQSKNELTSFVLDTFTSLKNRMEVIRKLNKNNWDIFFACITETDRFHHFLFDKVDDLISHENEQILKFYQLLDIYITEMYSWVLDNDIFILLSDHGFTKIKKEFYINHWLMEEGFQHNLFFEDGFLKGLTSAVKAFALDPCRIFIHLKDKYLNGGVDDHDYNIIVNELIDKLRTIELDGKKIMKHVFRKEELYTEGKYINKAADIICLPEDGIDIKGSFNKTNTFGESILTGMHTQHDALFFINNDFTFDHKLNIQELSNLIF